MSKKQIQYIATVNIGTTPITEAGNVVKVGKTPDAIDPDKLEIFIKAGQIRVEGDEDGSLPAQG